MDDMNGGPSMEMPRYQCHKKVWALKIQHVQLDAVEAQATGRETDGSATLHFTDSRYAPMRVGYDYMRKHNPKVGGYYVVYDDGYKSWSPADAFESGYTRI